MLCYVYYGSTKTNENKGNDAIKRSFSQDDADKDRTQLIGNLSVLNNLLLNPSSSSPLSLALLLCKLLCGLLCKLLCG